MELRAEKFIEYPKLNRLFCGKIENKIVSNVNYGSLTCSFRGTINMIYLNEESGLWSLGVEELVVMSRDQYHRSGAFALLGQSGLVGWG